MSTGAAPCPARPAGPFVHRLRHVSRDHCIIAKAGTEHTKVSLSDGAEPAGSMLTMACRNGTTDADLIKLFLVGNSLLSHVCAGISLAERRGLSVNNLFPTVTDVLGPRIKRLTLLCKALVHAL